VGYRGAAIDCRKLERLLAFGLTVLDVDDACTLLAAWIGAKLAASCRICRRDGHFGPTRYQPLAKLTAPSPGPWRGYPVPTARDDRGLQLGIFFCLSPTCSVFAGTRYAKSAF
jgi:hypothetical protein